ncbi:major facilitator superfamily domain-containing protein [Plectosphaerella cucumerina]|uniref:Major facilitator superfamily domain-containing protein n=1 Tax=Plectosphaerella cucumerina TaxID=40658 RepID=A0A8K0T8J0_9PEZI|nr:major facilitator superfamily domain-containing protein [Plectosphaerella cucumerina]
MATVLTKGRIKVSKYGSTEETTALLSADVAPLGVPLNEKKFFWQRRRGPDPDAIATQPSVFDDPDTADRYEPGPEWENYHRFDPSARWTWGEEGSLVRKIDRRIMVWACIMFMALELDRANIQQALTDNFLDDLDMTTNELPSQLVSKWVGPDRWVPAQMVLWACCASLQFWIQSRDSFLVFRALLGLLQGGFIPDVILYLSYFYKHHELTLRLGFFWTAMSFADILSALFAYGLLHMRGVGGQAGWRWLFLVEGLITLMVGSLGFVLMPAGPCQTASWFRGPKGWFTKREEIIMVNRVIRDDPSKSDMHNREALTPRHLWESLKDFDLWPIYLIGLTFEVPMRPASLYMTLTLRGLGFTTFQANLLSIPEKVGHIIMMLGITYLGEALKELSLVSMISQIWALPFLIFLNVVDVQGLNRWVLYAVVTLLLIYPNPHPIQVGWNSRNSNAVRSRTVSAACYNMFVQASGIIASNVYREDDAPRYERGNRWLLIVACGNIVLYLLVKMYYVRRNKQRDRIWGAMSEDERLNYLATTTDEGNKRLDFRFSH